MALSNLFGWNKSNENQAEAACGTACGAAAPKEPSAACGAAAPEKPSAACGSACGAGTN
ncbi:MAG: ACGX-repeat peptide [Lachnospiraceae bacterium]|nr:ACGX-repeat peptide [Lachnospiraceae bacterium]